MTKEVFIHPTAIVDSNRVGRGTRIWAFAHVMHDVSIGEDCNIGEHCFIESGVTVGDRSTIKNGAMLWEGVVIEEGVFVGPGVCFTNDLHPRSQRLPAVSSRYAQRDWLLSTRVRKGASLGACAVILAGVNVGEYALVGAGAVIVRDVPPHALIYGNPGRRRGWVCRCGESLEFVQGTADCPACQRRYLEHQGEERITGIEAGQAE